MYCLLIKYLNKKLNNELKKVKQHLTDQTTYR